ncbi:hypothetical protein H6P81_010480 [Aristolochia fimbriata]|uniref:Uncharacterized protein n=1 Tax=Aristolochia fimbriata TaxID=158543 RepID=A0AAV7ENW1_ARIFI|nr:hypothetical protein H6P81_010480 [Aristolochia fimbriata]
MFGTGLQLGRAAHGDDRFYNPVKARKNQQHQLQRNRTNGGLVTPASAKGKPVNLDTPEPESRTTSEEPAVPSSTSTRSLTSNLDRFLESTTPSIPAQYLSKTRMRGLRTCDIEFQPYFTLGDLWDSFKEWSAYGAGVPLILNGSDSVVQYYVPYLSAIQLYGESSRTSTKSRRAGEDSDGDYYRDTSSEGSSDSELERNLQWSGSFMVSEATQRMDRFTLREKHLVGLQEGFSSDDGEVGNSQGRLLFEYFERDQPYSREPLADKISDLSSRCPELKALRSCDLLSASWISVAWYPIYRIPTGPTLRDLDACFLTFHSLSTPIRSGTGGQGPIITYPEGIDGVPKISLPSFGLASYKFKGSMWTPHGGTERQLSNSLLLAADNWLRLLHVNHPDFQFFVSHGTYRR